MSLNYYTKRSTDPDRFLRALVRCNIPGEQWNRMKPLARIVMVNYLISSTNSISLKRKATSRLNHPEGRKAVSNAWGYMRPGPKPKVAA